MSVVATVAALAATPAAAVADPDGPDQPPSVSNTTFSPDTLPSSGGSVAVTADITDDVGLLSTYVDVVGSDGSALSVPLTLQSGVTYGATVVLPANATPAPVSYTITAWATDTNDATAGDPVGTVTVAAQLAPSRLKVSPKTVAFGSVRLGAVRRQVLAVKNTGRRQDGPIEVVAAASGPPFTLSGAGVQGVRLTLKPGQTKTVRVEFRPVSLGAQSGSVTLTPADPAQPVVTVPVIGKGVRR